MTLTIHRSRHTPDLDRATSRGLVLNARVRVVPSPLRLPLWRAIRLVGRTGVISGWSVNKSTGRLEMHVWYRALNQNVPGGVYGVEPCDLEVVP